jgi:acyl-CoA synthetase (AMP-forming)/AMP-acid ligase II
MPHIPGKRPVPGYWKRFKIFVLNSRKITTANFTDIMAEVYEDRPIYFLDHNLSFPFLKTDTITYRQLADITSRIGNALVKLGVQPRDRVALMTYNRVELAFCEFACWKIGAIPVPLNFMLRADEVRYQVQNCGAKVMITDRKVYFENIGGDISLVPAVDHWIVVSEGEPLEEELSLEDITAEESPELVPYQVKDQDDVAIIFYTSGTTGVPRGAMLTHNSMLFTLRTYSMLLSLVPTNKKQLAILVMPVAHTSGHQNMLILISMAIPMYFLSRFNAEEVAKLIQEHKATFFAGIPAMFKMMLRAGCDKYDLSSMMVWGGGADAFNDDLVNTFRQWGGWNMPGFRIKPIFARGYGMAETAGHVCITPPWPAGGACAGWVVPGIKWRLVDHQGRDVKKGDVGELVIKGPTIMKGYWNDRDKTRDAFLDNDWFRTGDMMYQGKYRLLYFVDREKDVIKCAGYSIFPTEVEYHLSKHPDLDKVVVIAIPDEVKGQLPVALAVPRKGISISPDQVYAWARENIAAYKCPRKVVFVDDIPLTFSLKPKRSELRKKYQHLFNQDKKD